MIRQVKAIGLLLLAGGFITFAANAAPAPEEPLEARTAPKPTPSSDTVSTNSMSPAQRERYHRLIEELRCLVCQNQNIAESNAPLAQDLRLQVEVMILAGQDDATIKQYMTERYGDFVLYRPPFKPQTLALWMSPPLLLLLVILVLVIRRRRRNAPTVQVDEKAVQEILERDQRREGADPGRRADA